jgi:hypothetical protein
MVHRVAEEAEADLDEIWWYIATESGGPDHRPDQYLAPSAFKNKLGKFEY